ncbi:MAG: hypothetical protein KatS3mg061_0084 [Dehalococcoidia bacterium]|nr:MAG: hypothetical protein KatS3mg061_0084 [Dehalococcoidia bacterium]
MAKRTPLPAPPSRPLLVRRPGWVLLIAGGALIVALFMVRPFLLTPAAPGVLATAVGGGATRPAPDFQVTTLDGTTFRLAEQRGRPVILYFMAAWCATCIPEAQALARLHQQYADRGLQVLALDVDPTGGPADLARFRDSVPGAAHYLWAIDSSNRVTRAYGVTMLDTKILVDPNGNIAYVGTTPTSYGVLQRALESSWQ